MIKKGNLNFTFQSLNGETVGKLAFRTESRSIDFACEITGKNWQCQDFVIWLSIILGVFYQGIMGKSMELKIKRFNNPDIYWWLSIYEVW